MNDGLLRVLCSLAIVAAPAAFASSPSPPSGTLSDTNPSLTYATIITTANATSAPPTCSSAANRYCDDYVLTVDLPAGYAANHPAGQIVITTSWQDANDDFDLYLLGSSGTTYLKTQANAGPSPEFLELPLSAVPGGGGSPVQFKIRIVLFSKGSTANAGHATTSIVLDPGPNDPCVLPGVRVVLDPSNDQDPNLGAATEDIQNISLAELAADAATVTFGMKVRDLSGALPASADWVIYFTGANSTIYWVRMETSASSAVSYSYGTRSGTTDTRVGAADSGSFAPDGNIEIKLATSHFGTPAVGQKLTAIFARTYQLVGAVLVAIDDETDTSQGAQVGSKQYTLVGNSFCGTPPPQTPCVLPGVTVVTDPAGDVGAPGGAQQDIRSISIAELGENTNALSFTMKVAGLAGSLQANGTWSIYFTFGGTEHWVNMHTDASSAASYSYGTRATSNGTSTDTTVGAADAGSFLVDGSITIKIATDKIGNPAAGQALTKIYGATYVRGGGPAGPGVQFRTDSAPDTQPGTAQYTLVGNTFCGTPPPQTPCQLPGIKVTTDGLGDQSPGGSNVDIAYVAIAELGADTNALTFTMKVSDLSTIPASSDWVIYFTAPNNTTYFVRMETNAQSAVTYSYGTSAGSMDTRLGAADAGSYLANGTIRVKVANAKIGRPAAGQKLTAIFGQTYQLVGVVLVGVDSSPDTTPGDAQYTLVGNAFCGNAAPVPVLAATPLSGNAPLPVAFDGSASSDPDNGDTIASYTFDFGDSTGTTTQATPTVSHTYTSGGNFHARLTVTDSRGLASVGYSEKIISVTGPPLAVAGPDSTVDEGSSVTLDGSGSSDGNSGALSYAWTQQAGSAVNLTGANTAIAGFTAPAVCDRTALTFRLKVSNTAGTSQDDVVVTVRHINQAPVANAGADQTVGRGGGASLDGRGSTHDACATLGYHWAQTAGPAVALSAADTAAPSFTAPDVSSDVILRFQLAVSDSFGGTASDTVQVRVDSSTLPDIGNTTVGATQGWGLLGLAIAGGLSRRRRYIARRTPATPMV